MKHTTIYDFLQTINPSINVSQIMMKSDNFKIGFKIHDFALFQHIFTVMTADDYVKFYQ